MAFRQQSRLSQHISFLKDLFKSYKDFSDRHIDTIELMLERLYDKWGLNDQTNFAALKPTDYPIMADLYEVIEQAYQNYSEEENPLYSSLRIEKRSDAGENLPGAVVRVEHIESGQTYMAQTNAAGVAIFDQIRPGAYKIQEISAPLGWKLDDTVYTATVLAGETATFTLVNEDLPGLRVVKYDRVNMLPMPNVTFEIWRDGVSLGKFKTDEFGEILLTNVQPGTFRAVEVDTGNEGYILDSTPQEIELSAGDGIRELLFFNDMKPGMRLVKVDSSAPSKVIPNAVFEIKSVAGDYGPEEYTTDENGEIDLSHLPTGAYVVIEKACPDYVIDDAQRMIQLAPNETAEFVFTNSELLSLRLVKLSSDSTPLGGVSFRLAKIEDDSRYLDRTTSPDGTIVWEGLEPGIYSDENGTPYDLVCGVFFLVGLGSEKFVSLTDDQLRRYHALYNRERVIALPKERQTKKKKDTPQNLFRK